ncbi:unnamed protein product [Blepharisma stoltei]|uniref:Uncharacterized protein n=1 Tax=Blepharisma stoltei TaxID=1481888 RepID=A0AAU9JVU5_9CILI|nr:unnamed protein product [Blepharisma stoltei]
MSSTVSQCTSCPDINCKICEDRGSGNTCLGCSKELRLISPLNIKKTSCCGDGKYVSSTQVECANCADPNCNFCEDRGSGDYCLKCYNLFSITTIAKIKKTSCCSSKLYWNNYSHSCEDCDSKCSECTDSKTNCLTCVDQINMSSPPACECPSNMYFDGSSSCNPCEQNSADNSYFCGNQTEKTCKSSKVGFNLGFNDNKIIVNFASKLKRDLQKKFFIVKFLNETTYDTENCTLIKINETRYEIETSIKDCDLPIFVNLTFGFS